jgi:hypothetical protein
MNERTASCQIDEKPYVDMLVKCQCSQKLAWVRFNDQPGGDGEGNQSSSGSKKSSFQGIFVGNTFMITNVSSHISQLFSHMYIYVYICLYLYIYIYIYIFR